MAEITKRRIGELLRGVFKILKSQPESMRAKDVLARLETVVPPTPFEASSYPNRPNVRRYEKIVRFATIRTVKAGWLVKTKGAWTVTDAGVQAYNEFQDPERFAKEASRRYREWQADQPATGESDDDVEVDQAAATIEEAEEAAWSEIEEHLSQMSPYDFQEVVAGLLRGMGYFVEWVSPPGPDKGIDIVAHVDPLGVKGSRIKAQVKRRAERTSSDGVRSFVGILGETDAGIFVSMGGFTKDAEEEARRQERKRIMLIDTKRLLDLWIQHYDQVPESQRRLLPLRAVYYLAPDD